MGVDCRLSPATSAAGMSMPHASARAQQRKPPALLHTSQPLSRRRGALAVFGAACLLGRASAQTTEQISVVTPSTIKVPGQDFSIKWSYSASGGTTGDLNSFLIELRYCGTDSSACDGASACGDEFVSLCTREDEGLCTDSDGSYDVQIPEDAEAGKYSIKVALSEDTGVFACTESFEVTAPAEGSVVIVEDGEPSLEAIAPDYLEAGSAFTAQWIYDNGSGEAEGTFEVNLNACSGADCEDGGCGTLSQALCADPGCYDPGTGDYDVVVPLEQPLGEYKLEVKNADGRTSHCTYSSFYVIEEGGEAPTVPPAETPVLETPAPVAIPTASPVAVPPPTGNPSAAPNAAPSGAPVTASPPTAPPSAGSTSSGAEGEPGSPGTPPSPVPARVECDPTAELSFVYTAEDTKLPLVTVSHKSGDRSEGGCLTLTKLYDWLAGDPVGVPVGLLYTVDPSTEMAVISTTATPTGVWLLSTSLEIINGVTFEIKGTTIAGGDCDELKFSSTVKKWNRIMGHGGNIYIASTLIRSWDVTKTLEHIFKKSEDGKSPRSFIACVSEVANPNETCAGVAQKDMGECRMDIIDSKIGYLGYDSTESYGITWKVRGLCTDLSNLDLFDSVRVYGDMINSEIYNMWYGMYSYGHLGGVWTDNIMRDNRIYGFDPHDDSDYLTIARNTVYGNGNHGIIASKRCDHLLVKDNIVRDNGGSGIMLHKSCDDSIVSGNECTDNFDAGLSLVETSRCSVRGNTFETNRWGFRITLGSTDNVFDSNTVIDSSNSDIYVYYGAAGEEPEVDPMTGINVNNVFSNNIVTHVSSTVVDIEDADGTEISSNTFSGEGGKFIFLRSTNTHVVDNVGDVTNGEADEITSSCFTAQSDRLPVCT